MNWTIVLVLPLAVIGFLTLTTGLIYLVIALAQRRHPAESALEFSHIQRHAAFQAAYERDNANQIAVIISQGLSEITTSATFTIELKGDWGRCDEFPELLFECWMDWPPYKPRSKQSAETYSSQRALIVEKVESDQDVIIDYVVDDVSPKPPLPNATSTRFMLNAAVGGTLPSSMTVSFQCPQALFALPESAPFDRKRLSIYFRLSDLASPKSILTLEYPTEIGLRGRKDNSQYYSLGAGVDDKRHKNLLFFPTRNIQLRCTYGTSNSSVLSSAGTPILYAGLGVLTSAIAFRLFTQTKTVSFVAGFIFVLTLMTWFLESVRTGRHFFPSAMIKHLSWTSVSNLSCATIVGGYLSLVAWVYTNHKEWEHNAVAGGVGLGLGLLALGILYFIALYEGVLQKYCCDECEGRFRLGRRYGIQGFPETRQTVHVRNCQEAVSARMDRLNPQSTEDILLDLPRIP